MKSWSIILSGSMLLTVAVEGEFSEVHIQQSEYPPQSGARSVAGKRSVLRVLHCC
jgi:hypothetical protein